MATTGTVKFEKSTFTPYNNGNAYRTVFLINTVTGIATGGYITLDNDDDLTFRPMYKKDTLTDGTKLEVRSYEVYADSDGDTDDKPDENDNTSDVYERLARIASEDVTDTEELKDYDLQRVQDDVEVIGATLTYSGGKANLPTNSTITLKNLLDSGAQFRFVVVCNVVPA